MDLKPIPFKKAKIDSFTLLIPLENVQIISTTFTQKYSLLFDETSEIEDNECFYKNYLKTENKEKGTFFKYKKLNRIFNGVYREFVQIMLTSKHLHSDYFQGINAINIEYVYNNLMLDNVIFMEYDEFLKAYVTDIDICKDYELNIDAFKDLKKGLLDNVLEDKKHLLYSKKINSKEMFGIMYNERSKATNTKPFAKLYYKTSEILNEKNISFFDANLQSMYKKVADGITRVEVTIKASNHKKYLGVENVKTLIDLLDLTEIELSEMHKSILGEYYECKERNKTKESVKMDSNDLMLVNAIEYILKYNKAITSAELIHTMQLDSFDKKQRHFIKEKTLKIIEISKSKKKIESNDLKRVDSIDVMKDLGIFE